MKRNANTTSLELDSTSADILVRLAEMWGVTEGEAIRRALTQAHSTTSTSTKEERLEAFKELQRSLGLDSTKAARWQEAVREARR